MKPPQSNFEDSSVKSSSVKSCLGEAEPKTREDFLNFSIENDWKEMEELQRSKKAAQDLFSKF